MSIELALTPDSRWTADVAAMSAAAGGAGFSGLGLALAAADATSASTLAGEGLHCHELMSLQVTDDAATAVALAHRLAAAAETVQPRWVLTSLKSPLNAGTAATIAQCATILAEAGTRLAVEFMPFSALTSIEDGLAAVEAAGAGRAGVLIDVWHFFAGDSTWEQLAQVPLEQIAYVHFDDAPVPVSDDPMNETINRRVFPGEGVLEIQRFAATLLDRGWDGLVSVEVLNAELLNLPLPEFAQRAYTSTAAYWR